MHSELHDLTKEPPVENPVERKLFALPFASSNERASAFFTDAVLAFGAANALTVHIPDLEASLPFSRELSLVLIGFFPLFLGACLYVIMSILATLIFGQTPGKRLAAIKVVPYTAAHYQEHPSLVSILLREVLGKFASLAILGFGFLRILGREDRRALHDTIGATKVISVRGQKLPIFRPAIHFGVALGVSATCAAAVVGGYNYLMNHTEFPLRYLASKMQSNGVKIAGVKGNANKGFKVETVVYENEDFSVEAQGLHLSYEKKRGKWGERVINELFVDRAIFTLKKSSALDDKPAAAKADQKTDRQVTSRLPISKALILKYLTDLRVANADLQNVEVRLPTKPAFSVGRLFVSNLEIKPSARTFDVERVWLESEYLNLDLKKINGLLPLNGHRPLITLEETAAVVFKPKVAQMLLRSPVDFRFTATWDGTRLVKLDGTGWGGKAKYSFRGSTGNVEFFEFSPFHYFHTDAPIWSMSMKAAGDFEKPSTIKTEGTARLRNETFKWRGLELVHSQYSAVSFTSDYEGLKKLLHGGHEALVIRAGEAKSVRDVLAAAYYRVPSKALTLVQSKVVEHDSRYFVLPQANPPVRSPSSSPAGTK